MEKEPSESQNPRPSPKDASDTPANDGFISRLAKRSAGLDPPAKSLRENSQEKSPWKYAGLGLEMVGSTLIFAGIGYYLDQRFGWTPWGLLTLTLLGLIGGLYLLIKEALRITK